MPRPHAVKLDDCLARACTKWFMAGGTNVKSPARNSLTFPDY
jgi:hypothetical protein